MDDAVILKAFKCVKRFITQNGNTIIEDIANEHGDDYIVYYDNDEDEMVIAKIRITDGEFPEEAFSRKKFEAIAAEYLSNLDKAIDAKIRGDVIDVRIINEDRGFLRHHKRFV